MKKTKRLLGVLFVLIFLIQSTSLAFANGGNEQEEILDDAIQGSEQEVILDTIFQKMSDEEIMKETEELHKQVQELRKQRGPVTLSQDEVAAKALAEERADIIDAIDQEVEECIASSMAEESSIEAVDLEIEEYITDSSEEELSNNDTVQEISEEIAEPTKGSLQGQGGGTRLSGSFSGGSGTKQDPYIITLASEMDDISLDLSAYYSLGNNINMSGISWVPIGPFTGGFDGNNYVISNLTVSSSAASTGLFGTSNGATIENIKMSNANISGIDYVGGFVGLTSNTTLSNLELDNSSISGRSYVGGIIGAGSTKTEVYECKNNGIVNATGGCVGGIAGYMKGTMIQYCVFSGTVSASINDVGGIVGMLQNMAYDCTNIGTVNGYQYVGGIAGTFAGLTGNVVYIIRSFNSGKISGYSEVAGIAGYGMGTGGGFASINYSANQGNIKATWNFAGGMMGDSYYDVYIQRVYNTGELDSRIFGGLVARFYGAALRYGYNAWVPIAETGVQGTLVSYNYGTLIGSLYYIPSPVPPVRVGSSSGMTSRTVDTMRTVHTLLGYPHTQDSAGINGGFPIIDGINYIFPAGFKFLPFFRDLNVLRIEQETNKTNWCWAASGLMVGKYVCPSSTADQYQIVDYVQGDSSTNDAGSLSEAAEAVEYASDFTVSAFFTVSPKSFDYHMSDLDNNKPIIMRVGWWDSSLGIYSPANGHFLVLDGYDYTPGNSKLKVIDPWHNATRIDWVNYSDLVGGCSFQSGSNGKYTNTVYIN